MITRRRASSRERPPIPGLDAFYRQFYDDPLFNDFYSGSGYANFGFWTPGTRTASEAGDALVERVLAGMPGPQRFRGDILDVACGHGASTRRLLEHYPPERIVAIGVEPDQVRAARARAPGVRIEQMDAVDLEFADARFETVLCIEAAFHFQTREQFFREALRVLKPGGYLLMSDLLMARTALLVPPDNFVQSVAGYRRIVERSGFADVQVTDETARTWRAYRRALNAFIAERIARRPNWSELAQLATLNVTSTWSVRACVLVAARKPR